MLCLNLRAESSGLVDEDDQEILKCSLIKESDLQFATSDDVRGAVRRLSTFAGTPELDLRSQAIGFRHEPHNLLNDTALDGVLKPVEQFVHDWMHGLLVNGCCNTVTFLVLDALYRCGLKDIYTRLQGYADLWTTPARVTCARMGNLFIEKRTKASRKAKTFKATASECLSVYPILALFVLSVVVPSGKCMAECKAFLASADLVDMLSAVPLGIVTPEMLKAAVSAFLEACVSAGWTQHTHPKFHWCIHLPQHLATVGMLVTCWVHERKHRCLKRYLDDMHNTRVLDRSIVSEVVCHHLHQLRQPDTLLLSPGLIQARPARAKLVAFLQEQLQCNPPLQEALMSHHARIQPTGSCARGDVVLIKSDGGFSAAEVWVHVEIFEVCLTLCSVWGVKSYDTGRGCAEWHKTTSPQLVALEDILCATTHCISTPGVCRTIVPWHLRSLQAV